MMTIQYHPQVQQSKHQGPWSNFEIWGGGTISDSILGGTRHLLSLTLYNSTNIGGGAHEPPPCPPALWSLNIDLILILNLFADKNLNLTLAYMWCVSWLFQPAFSHTCT